MSSRKGKNKETLRDAQTRIPRAFSLVDPITGAIGSSPTDAVSYRNKTKGKDDELFTIYDLGPQYSAYRNFHRRVLESAIGQSEGLRPEEIFVKGPDGKETSHVMTTPDGRSAVGLPLGMLHSGDFITGAPKQMYPGTSAQFNIFSDQYDMKVSLIDCTPEELNRVLGQSAESNKRHLIFTEPLTNPNLGISNLPLILDVVNQHRARGRKNIVTVADNTMTPLLIRPLELGFDISVLSLTKFHGGNSLMGGAVVVNPNRPDLAAEMGDRRRVAGPIMAGLSAKKFNELMPTLALRLREHCNNAFALAKYLKTRPEVDQVFYPGLKDSPDHKLAKKLMGDYFGGLVSFTLKGDASTTNKFARATTDTSTYVADSFALPTTTVNVPARQSGYLLSKTPGYRTKLGITDTFVRVSVGFEDSQDIIRQFEAIFDRMGPAQG